MSETYTSTGSAYTTYQPVVYTPPPPPKPEIYSAATAEQNSKGVVSYSTAVQDLQNMDDRSIQSRYSMSRPELERAISQLQQQIEDPKVDQTYQADAGLGLAGRTKNSPRVDLVLVGQYEDLSGMPPKQRQTEMTARANVALTAYSRLKEQGQNVFRLSIRKSSDDPTRYNVDVEFIAPDGTKQKFTIKNVDPEHLEQLAAKLAEANPSLENGKEERLPGGPVASSRFNSYQPQPQEKASSGSSTGYNTSAEKHWTNLAQIIDNAKQQFRDRLAALERESEENNKAYEKRAQEKKEEEKRIEAKQTQKRVEAARQAKKIERDMETRVISDPRELVELALRIIDEESKARRA